MFGLVYKSVSDENVIGTLAAQVECPLEWVGYVGISHELH